MAGALYLRVPPAFDEHAHVIIGPARPKSQDAADQWLDPGDLTELPRRGLVVTALHILAVFARTVIGPLVVVGDFNTDLAADLRNHDPDAVVETLGRAGLQPVPVLLGERVTSGGMLPHERLDVDVAVLVDGTWWPGVLEHRRQVGERWEGFVRWSTGPGENRIGWYSYEQLREA